MRYHHKSRMRDDFSQTIKDKLAARAGHKCSNPDCRAATVRASSLRFAPRLRALRRRRHVLRVLASAGAGAQRNEYPGWGN